MNDGNNKNLLIAMVLSLLVFAGWQYFVATPQMKAEQARQQTLAKQEKTAPPQKPGVGTPGLAGIVPGQPMTREAALKAGGPRVAIDTPMVDGSIRLTGAKLDDLRLKNYHLTVDPKSPEIVLLAPRSTHYPYYAGFGWVGAGVKTPDDNSVWQQTSGAVLAPGKPVTLSWDNGQGLTFTRVIAIDDQYMFTVIDSVANASGKAVTLYPYGAVERQGIEKDESSLYLHVGFVGVAEGKEIDAKYSDFKEAGTPPKDFASTGGWVGITDKYWMAAAVPPQNEKFDGQYLGTRTASGVEAYQASYRLGARPVAAGGRISVTHRLFAGAKVVNILRGYQDSQKIARFDNAVDWGMLSFLTRPFFLVLDWLYKLLGNFGLAILGLTVVVKLLFFPLQSASFRSMSKMKKLQPEMERLKKTHADDPQKFQIAMMELYKREKANPISGCVPILLTIPVFIALYKVLFVSIEMRHAPFYGWIHDLSAPDPTSWINLFGLLPFDPHAILPGFLLILNIGVWPLIYGVTMWVQQKLNPAPTDPVQAKMFAFMPLIFTFLFGSFPAGLVIYYSWSNVLNMLQQYIIMRREGVEVHLFENLKLAKKKPAANDG
jgi:YidC/Oxa1 family membrane protein insertase